MKAVALSGYGHDNVSLQDVPDPEAGPGEVVVRVRAASLNHLDLFTLSGVLGIEHHFPHPLGADGAGEIDSVGEGVKGLKPGTPVMINPGHSCRQCELCRAGEHSECPRFRMLGEHLPGTLAEKVVVPHTNVYPFPEALSFSEAAALGVTFITAYRMLFSRGHMRPGEWVLITGIGGGLAQSLFQLARPLAGRVFVTSSSRAKLDQALEMGADAGIHYQEEEVGKTIRHQTGKRGVDLVVDSAGGPSIDQALSALRKGGRVVVAGATAGRKAEINVSRLFWNQLSIVGSTMGSDRDVSDMLRMVSGMGLRPLIQATYPLAK
ncbi:MAG TPA: zinc-binding dehydrogenase, partial [Actinomycetota bacterium]|nr:zinc-binding dehydrogenase [Actinomycetota bacterium]